MKKSLFSGMKHTWPGLQGVRHGYCGRGATSAADCRRRRRRCSLDGDVPLARRDLRHLYAALEQAVGRAQALRRLQGGTTIGWARRSWGAVTGARCRLSRRGTRLGAGLVAIEGAVCAALALGQLPHELSDGRRNVAQQLYLYGTKLRMESQLRWLVFCSRRCGPGALRVSGASHGYPAPACLSVQVDHVVVQRCSCLALAVTNKRFAAIAAERGGAGQGGKCQGQGQQP